MKNAVFWRSFLDLSIVVELTVAFCNIFAICKQEMYRDGKICSIMYCTNRTSDKVGKSFYRFPKDREQCSQWVHMCHKKDLDEIFKHHGAEYMYCNNRVCSDHFATSCFMNSNNKSSGLIKGSIPSLHCGTFTATGAQKRKQGSLTKLLPSPDSLVALSPLEEISGELIGKVIPDARLPMALFPLEEISEEPIGKVIPDARLPMALSPLEEISEEPIGKVIPDARLPMALSPLEEISEEPIGKVIPDARLPMALSPLEEISEEPIGKVLPDARLPKMTMARFTAIKSSLKIARATNKRQRQTILHQRQVIAELKKTSKLPLPDDSVSANQFILSQLSKRNTLPRGQRYSNYDKNFALALHYCSPKCYRFLRKIFVLPTVRSLTKWLQNIDVKPGLNSAVLEILKIKSKTLPSQHRLCTIAFDEMSLKELVSYNSKSDLFEGFMTNNADALHDLGSGHTGYFENDNGTFYLLKDELLNIPVLANQAMVVMIRGIQSNFKQVIGYFLARNAMSGNILQNIVTECIRKVQDTGFIPKVIVTDQGSNNVSMRKLLGISELKPYVGIAGEKIFFFYDAPHLLKSVRNNFKQYNIEYLGNVCEWKHLVDFHAVDSKLPHRLAPKLSKKHLNLPPFSPMRVSLAAQTMSSSVATGILTCIALNAQGISASAAHTANFLSFIDGLFDVFNSCSVHDAKRLRSALKQQSHHHDFLSNARNDLKSLRVFNKDLKNPPCIQGWVENISALNALWNDLHMTYDVQFLLTRRMTQDCLENLFSVVRFRGGNNVTPDCSKFRSTLKMAMSNQLLQPSDLGNCELDFSQFLLTKKEIESSKVLSLVPSRLSENTMVSKTESSCDNDAIIDNLLSLNSLTYVTGWVCSQLTHIDCRQIVSSYENSFDAANTHIYFKKYTDECKLLYPKGFAIALAKSCMNIFCKYFYALLHRSCFSVKREMKALVIIPEECQLCKNCRNVFLDKFFNTTIKAFLLRTNSSIQHKTGKSNKKFRKMTHQ